MQHKTGGLFIPAVRFCVACAWHTNANPDFMVLLSACSECCSRRIMRPTWATEQVQNQHQLNSETLPPKK